jgi:hypothetical protein
VAHEHLAGLTEAELRERLKDPHWRIRNLYYVLDEDANTVLFIPNEVQAKFLDDIWYRNVIPKARQRGFSTVAQLMMLDACLFKPNTGAAIIAQDEDTAKGIRNNKIKFAYDRLPEFLRRGVPLTTDNVTELQWANGSFMLVALSTRGRTLQYLHVSEYGKICARAPDKAKEIQAGSLPSVDQHGVIVIESTAEGQEGDFYEKCQQALAWRETGRPLSPMHYRLHFASWWDAVKYETDPEFVTISERDQAYFHRMEPLIGRELPPRKRAWYVAKRDNDFGGDQEMMWSQYPTTVEEAFMVSTEGTYLADQMSLARRQGRITRLNYNPTLPVDTFWDLGYGSDDTCLWCMQTDGVKELFIDFLEFHGEPPSVVVREMQRRGYVWGKHYLPHDGNKRNAETFALKTYADQLTDLGLKNIEIVPRADDLVQAINLMRDDFANDWYDEEKCAEGIKHLAGYRKDWNDRLGVWSTTPRKNGHQHAADARRQKSQAKAASMLGHVSETRVNRRNRSGMAA